MKANTIILIAWVALSSACAPSSPSLSRSASSQGARPSAAIHTPEQAVGLTAPTREFTAAVAEAARKYRTTEGRAYAAQLMPSVAPALAKAMRACKSREFKTQSFYDLVFIVSPAGSVRRVRSTPTSPFALCIAAQLQLPASLAKPPQGSWPIHIRLLHGRMLLDEADPPFNIFSDDVRAPLIRPNPPSGRPL